MVIKLLRRATGSWTLERKSILFFGTTLLVSIFTSFYIVHWVSKGLVLQATKQTAQDYAQLAVYNKHMGRWDRTTKPKGVVPFSGEGFDGEVRQRLYEKLIYNPRYKVQILSLDPITQHDNLSDAEPISDEERDLLQRLQVKFRQLQQESDGESANPSPSAVN